ncbi:MAG: rhodanese-like domain-containing protein [Actinomycetes bacterium]
MLTDVTVDDLDAARRDGATVLDVRQSDEYAAGHVPGAQLLPLSMLPIRMQNLPRNEPVYVVCQSGGRSAQAAELLDNAGMDVRNVVGGTSAWIGSGRPIETGAHQ